MHSMPMSRVAPLGFPASSLDDVAPTECWIVAEEDFLLSDPLTVDALLVETMLACFSWEMADGAGGFASSVSDSSPGGDDSLSFFGGGVGGTPDFLSTVFLPGADVEVEEVVERMELLEMVRFAGAGANRLLSTGEDGGFLLTTEALEAVDGTRDRAVLGDDTVVFDLTLTVDSVDAVETTRDRVLEVGVTSDLAVSKAVELSLVEDKVEEGRDNSDGGRRVEGPAAALRTVDACDLTDFTDAADDRTRLGPSLVEATEGVCRLPAPVVALSVRVEEYDSSGLPCAERGDTGLPMWPGVSLESGLVDEIFTVFREDIVARETVE